MDKLKVHGIQKNLVSLLCGGGGGGYLREALRSGFTGGHKKLTLIWGVATFGESLLSEL